MKKLLKIIIISTLSIMMLYGCTNKVDNINQGNSNEEIANDQNSNKDNNTDDNVDAFNKNESDGANSGSDTENEALEEEKTNLITMNSEDVRIPILMYHSISDENPDNSLMVPPAMFKEQMEWLDENGFTAMDLNEATEAMKTGKVPEKPVVITFDDGYMDNYLSAFPVLKEHKLKATFFVITDGVDNGYYMSSDMLKEMQSAGMVIENHTANHLELNTLSREDAYESIRRGQAFLRDTIGSDGDYLCYPVGRYSDETIEICKELGIKAAVTTEEGKSSINDGDFQLKRVRIYPMSIDSFAATLSE